MNAETPIRDDTVAVGWYDGPDGPVAYLASDSFFVGAFDTAQRRLAALGIRAGDIVIVCSQSAEVLQFAPFERASNALHAAFSCVEASTIDGPRLRSFIELFHPRAVLGVNAELLDGLDLTNTTLAQIFSGVEVVAARPSARHRLRAAGVETVLWLDVGPLVAVECRFRAGAHLDPDYLESGALDVATIRADPVGSAHLTTGVSAKVVWEACACGSTDPRVLLDS